MAASLSQKGFKKGDVFGIFSTNCPEYAIIFHAVAMLGGINTTVNPLYTAEEAAFQLKNAGAKLLVTAPPFIETAIAAAHEANITELFVFGEANGATPFASLLESDGVVPHVEIDPKNDLVALPYSSGTTGLAKGVMLTHHNLVANMCQMDGLDYFRSRRYSAVRVAAVSHLRFGGRAEYGSAPGRDDRDHAAVRSRTVPDADSKVSGDAFAHRAAHRFETGAGSDDRRLMICRA